MLEDRIQEQRRTGTLESRAQRWTLGVVALLMVLQAAGLAIFSVVYLSQVNWIRERALPGLSSTAVDTILFSVLSIPLALLAGRAVYGLMNLRRGAWLHAMIIQALLLIFALTSYVMQEANSLTYWTLFSCIIVVLYLNTHEIRSSFHADSPPADPTELFGGPLESIDDPPLTRLEYSGAESEGPAHDPNAARGLYPDADDTPPPSHSPSQPNDRRT